MAKQPDAWVALLQAAIHTKRPDGPGWKNVAEMAAEFGISERAVRNRIATWQRAGKIEIVHGRSAGNNACRYVRPVEFSRNTRQSTHASSR